jgi:phosphoglycerol geranylgeranyltransferase
MRLTELAGRFESYARMASIGGRRLLGLDTNPVPADWRHVTKVDPEASKPVPVGFPLYLARTSAVSVGGSRGVTVENTEATFALLEHAPVPAVHEPSAAGHVSTETAKQMEFLAVPEVLNGDSEALIGTLGEGLEHVREELGPEFIEQRIGFSPGGFLEDRTVDAMAAYLMDEAVFEAYIIMNPDSAAAREANVTESELLSAEEARRRALAAEYHLESEVLYLEYSGTFGGEEAVELLAAIEDATSWTRVWYGGGLDSRDATEQVLAAGADAVVVGDIFHDIAAAEARLVERAREQFRDVPDLDRVHSWLSETAELDLNAATRYLSTIPDVAEPESLAHEYLAATVRFVLLLADEAAEYDEPTASQLTEAAEAVTDRVADTERATLEGESARCLALALLGDRFDVSVSEDLPAEHIGVEL